MISLCSRRPVTVFMVTAALCILGVLSWQRLPVQLLPQFVFPEVTVNTILPNAFPEQLEREALIPVEAELASLEGVREIESQVQGSRANTKVVFDPGVDMKFALIKLQQKMNAVQTTLPEGARVLVERFDTADFATFLMQASLRGDMSLDDLREMAERRVRPRLEQVDGVVNVMVGGGRRSTIAVMIDPDRCDAHGIPVSKVQEAVNAYHQQRSHLGRVKENGRWLDVNLEGRIDDIGQLRDLIIDRAIPLRLGEVAAVGYSTAERTELYRVDGKASVGLFIQKDNVSNMLAVGEAVLLEIDRVNAELAPEGIDLAVGANQAEFVQAAIDQIETHAVSGLVLALIVLFLFLRSIRFVAILMLAIPVSLLVTFNLMFGWDLSINILSLCGLALAIGMLVDNGIVVLENVFRRYQLGESSSDAAVTGTKEMSRSIFAATGTTVLVFMPVLFVDSEARLFVRELSLSVIFPLVVSLVVALTVIPVLAGRVLKGHQMRAFGSGRLLEIYRVLLKAAIRHRIQTVALVGLLLLISLFLGLSVILARAPAPPPDQFDVYITAPRGATLEATDAIVRRIEEQVAEFPDMKEFRTNVRLEQAQITIEFVDQEERKEPLEIGRLKDQLLRRNKRLQGATVGFDPPQSSGGGGGGADLGSLLSTSRGLRLRGYDMNALRQFSEQLVQTLRTIPEVNQESVVSDLKSGAPEIQVRGDRERLARAGMNMLSLMQVLPSARTEGLNAATPFYTSRGDVNIQLVLLGADEAEPEDIEDRQLRNLNGQPVVLSEVADVRMDEGAGNIVRFNQERQVRISYDYTSEVNSNNTQLALAETQIAQLIETFRLPRGFVLEQIQPEDTQEVYYWMLGIGALLIFMFLAAQFESLMSPIIVLGTVPTAIIGASWALMLSGTALSMGEGAPMALLGLIVLLGIVVNNGIILLDRISSLRRDYGFRWQRAVITASQQRVRPIVMTSATTMLGVFPLALKQGAELEIWPPFAITILGGLAVSTFSTLVFIPVLYVGLEQTRAWCQKIGTVGLIAGTALSAGALLGIFEYYPSKLWVGLMSVPLWFLVMGLIYAIQQFLRIRSDKAQVTETITGIRIRNLTKIYGAPGQFRRDWQKHQRRFSNLIEQGKLPWTGEHVTESGIWLGASGLLLAFLHYYLDSPFWIFTVSLITGIWVLAVRELWYVMRFVKGWSPRSSSAGWRSWVPLKRFKQSSTSESDPPATPLAFVRQGGIFIAVALIVYLHLRLDLQALTVISGIATALLFQMRRIGTRIRHGHVDPDLPRGRFRRLKRLTYRLVKSLPFIRPPVGQIAALNGVDLDIGRGMFGLLGPNGAGKTTLMRILVGVLNENHGSIFINDRKLSEEREIFHGAIGYLPQEFGLYENMTPYDYLENHALTNGIYEPEVRRELIEDILRGVGLWERQNDQIGTFSGGMKQRVGIAQTLLHLPQIIVVDEPTVGLDPRERIRFRNLLAELAKERIVIFSTHIVEDIASTCHDLAVLYGGEVLYRGSPEVLQERAVGKVFQATIPEGNFDYWREQLHIVNHSRDGETINIRFIEDLAESPNLKELHAEKVVPNLEDAYVYLLQKAG